ncbi:MAG: GDSL-type esterase/lipase family protein, partial [Planctomycetales bacterium]
LAGFRQDLNKLLDALAETKARIVLVSPIRHEKLPPPLPDPANHNRQLEKYVAVLADVAKSRQAVTADLFHSLQSDRESSAAHPLTDNGIHLTPHGYRKASLALERELGVAPPPWRVEISVADPKPQASGTQVSQVAFQENTLKFQAADEVLPSPRPPAGSGSEGKASRSLVVKGLPPGDCVLRIDGKSIVKATAKEWAEGVSLSNGPEFDQADALRTTIVEKNSQYFHRWRPQNWTYLFGFRKREQGNNAVEIPKFDPLVAELEQKIMKLRVPQPHAYQLSPANK